MSRYFEALRQAGRLVPDAPDEWQKLRVDAPPSLEPASAPPVGDAPGSAAAAAPALAPVPGLAEALAQIPAAETAGGAAAAAPTAPEADAWASYSRGERPAGRSRLVETELTVSVDGRVRLMPNADDRAVVEHYRRLRTKMIQQHAIAPYTSVVITSANPQEGKTLTTLNIALSFAMLPSFRVLVVDGDLRRGSIRKFLGSEDLPGFSNLVDGTATLDEVVMKSEGLPFHLMLSGNSKAPAGELLNWSGLRGCFKEMASRFSLILVDSPPVNLVADAQMLAGACDAVLLVTRAYSTNRKQLERAAQDLQPFRILGSILNGGTKSQLYRGEYY